MSENRSLHSATDNLDETFRKLTQKTFDDVYRAIIANNLLSYKGTETEDVLRYHGWTIDEYISEWVRRYG